LANTSGPQASIGNGQTLNSDAAAHYLALVALILLETGIAIVATEGTRTYARQKYLFDGYRAGKPGFNPAWSPDHPQAYHLSGRAVDVGSGVGYLATLASKAFYARAGRFGFRPTVNGEPWHFEFRPEWAEPGILTAASSPVPDPLKEDDISARLYRNNKTGEIGVADLSTGLYWHVPNGDYVTLVRTRRMVVDEAPVELNADEWGFLQFMLTTARLTTNPTTPVNLDTASIARTLSAAVLEAVKGAASTISAGDLSAIAKAVSDEQANRLKA
jgi:hypothetical protein